MRSNSVPEHDITINDGLGGINWRAGTMKKKISVFLALLFAGGFHAIAEGATSSVTESGGDSPQAKAEEPALTEKKPKKDHRSNIFFGGYINLSFGTYKVIGIEPMIGYKVTPKFSTGVKVRYNYIQDERYPQTRTTSTYGGSIFARYLVTPKFYAQVEPATYNYETFYVGDGSERDWVPMFFVGGGFIQPLSERSWLNVQILFDVLQDDNSPYEDWDPFFSIGVGVGI
jgi:hypothetical protein